MSSLPKIKRSKKLGKVKSIYTLNLQNNGGKKVRLRRRLSLMVILGKTNNQIARELNVSYSTVSKWMQDPEVQEYISTMEENYYVQVERKYTRLLNDSVDRARMILRKGSDPDAISIIDRIWKGQGKLPVPRGSDVPQISVQQIQGQSGTNPMERNDAQYALEWLRHTRNQVQELEGVEE